MLHFIPTKNIYHTNIHYNLISAETISCTGRYYISYQQILHYALADIVSCTGRYYILYWQTLYLISAETRIKHAECFPLQKYIFRTT